MDIFNTNLVNSPKDYLKESKVTEFMVILAKMDSAN